MDGCSHIAESPVRTSTSDRRRIQKGQPDLLFLLESISLIPGNSIIMGRWRGRNRRNNNHRNNSNNNEQDVNNNENDSSGASQSNDDAKNDTSYNLWHHWTTRRDLLRYLRDYRQGCVAFYEEIKQEQMRLLQAEDDDDGDDRAEGDNGGNWNRAPALPTPTTGPTPLAPAAAADVSQVSKSCSNNHKNKTNSSSNNNKEEEVEGVMMMVIIGGVVFPLLGAETFRQRHLILPRVLAGRQRRIVHDCCVEADLFHDSYNNSGEQAVLACIKAGVVGNKSDPQHRTIVISCYADGFDTIAALNNHNTVGQKIEVHTYKPWYYRRRCQGNVQVIAATAVASPQQLLPDDKEIEEDRIVGRLQEAADDDDTPTNSNRTKSRKKKRTPQDEAEEQAVRAIFKLIDQPGDCLRDGRDVLVYDTLHRASLADVDPPQQQHGDDNSPPAWMLVDTAAKMKQCIQELEAAQPSEIAFDVEAYNVSKYTQLTCLLQVTSDAGKEFVIDTLAPGVWDEVHGLASLFANPAIVKVGHSIGGLDAKCLHRDFGIFLVNAFDTYEASKILGLESHGLAAVCAHYGLRDCATYLKLKETYQTCDWRARPLTGPMILYARYDVHYLLQLRWLLMRDMVRSEFWGAATAADGDARTAAAAYEEGKLVAESLARTLVQFDLADDEYGGIITGENGGNLATHEGKKQDIFDFMIPELKARVGYDDDASFKTPMQRDRGDDDVFYTPSSSVRNISVLEFDDDDDDEERSYADITAAKLRLQPLLMSCLSLSQERCRDLWSTHNEPHLKNDLFVSLVKRTKRREVTWTPSNTELYDELYHWRNLVAEEMECLPGFVAPLDFLVSVAWKRPTTEAGMRRITNQLPALLEESEEHRSWLLDLVLRKTLEDGDGVATATVYFYSSLNLPSEEKIVKRDLGISSVEDFSYEGFALKLFVAGTIAFGVIAALLDARRPVRK